MKPVEIISNTLFYRTPDGRIVFRPWGSKGPCYLLSESQRVVRSRIQLAYYLALFVVCFESITNFGIGIMLTVVMSMFIVGNYALYWLFTLGLPKTSVPEKPSPQYVQEQIKNNNRNFGKLTLWLLLITSTLMCVGGFLGGILVGDYLTAMLGGGFFGLCSFVFAKQLKNS